MQRNMFATVVALVATVALATLGGCGGSSSNPPIVVLDGIVAGNAADGATPVANATVKLTPTSGTGGPYMTTTDASGAYTLDVPPGDYALMAYRDVDFQDFTATVNVTEANTTTQDIAFLTGVSYIGSAACLGCHGIPTRNPEVEAFVRSGHPFKLNKVTGGVAPMYPFTAIDDVEALIADDGLEIPATVDDPAVPDPNGTLTDNTLGIGPNLTTWNDITYVIGGFGWKARFIDTNGFIITGSNVQYNFFNTADGIWHWDDSAGKISAYHNNEVDKKFNCGNCHTTGWRRYDADLNPARQDNLAGMDGTFAQAGIHCEACHGAGSVHMAAPAANPLPTDVDPRTLAQLTHHSAGFGLPIACGECHTRDGERDYPSYVSAAQGAGWAGDANWDGRIGGRIAASGGFVRHHEQYDEVVGIDPDSSPLASTRSALFAADDAHGNCMTCHDPHATTRFQDISGDQPGMDTTCESCHSQAKYTDIDHVVEGRATCIDCHMPLFSKSAQATDPGAPGLPSAGGHPAEGDVRSHIWAIDLSKTYPDEQFTDGTGGFAYPWLTGYISCNKCHYDGGPAFGADDLSAVTIHQDP